MSNKMDRPLVTVDGRTLMDRPLEPPNFVVDTLISQGLHILAGSPKVGKSWLALWLAVTVAKGEPVWGMSVKQGTTLYLCLEDSVLRIQNRLFEITEDAPDSVHFCTECAPIGQGLEEQVEGFLVAHPDTVLVLVDTLQMVRPVHDATYANDYRDLSVLKRLADKHGIAILLIHHLRKETADDVFNRTAPSPTRTKNDVNAPNQSGLSLRILMKSWWIRKPGISYRRCDLISAAARIWMSRICSLDWCIVRTAVSPWYCTGRTP